MHNRTNDNCIEPVEKIYDFLLKRKFIEPSSCREARSGSVSQELPPVNEFSLTCAFPSLCIPLL
jgi:hypothetical protein